jgi:hypothetical protein
VECSYDADNLDDLSQRLFNLTDDNALINQICTPLEEGHEVDIAANAHSFCELDLPVLPTLWQNFPASPDEKFGR